MLSKTRAISRLLNSREDREGYLRAKLNHLIPSQIKALRLNEKWTQQQLGKYADMKQARISAIEKPGSVAFTLDTLIGLAAAFRVGLQVKFVPLSQMVRWENHYSQDHFKVDPIEKDRLFLEEETAPVQEFDNGIKERDLNLVSTPFDWGQQELADGTNSGGAMYGG